ncbi:anhydro-N-acetylmuramic acid kinase [Oceanicella actignis]|uniref:anhydro-N-acetylmuramic acid kinase n=1 Tax=Oceanicella actignis TaxID=1189325 RepID=UPI0011E79AC9|nr:anhydro-N-acetylmuramic acid kinase [Oceanicella actignis]TYO88494.1 anhydro-N-acetylmuramic acid kinase [Oceanicella actignis]
MNEAAHGPVWALGLMSGTSLDGIDAALVLTDGETPRAFGPSLAAPYGPGDAPALRRVHADWRPFRPPRGPAEAAALAAAEDEVLTLHARAARRLLAAPGAPPAAIVGFHGQTVAHAPDQGWTWQLGDGAALARALGVPVAWDFRSADMRAGGQGAPLAPFFHFALARMIGADAPLAFLNLGGVGNVTWVDPAAPAPEAPGALVAFDTGPGNALIDDWMRARAGAPCDENGAAAAAGRVRARLARLGGVAAWLERPPPKSLDRNDFAPAMAAVAGMSVEDGAATLTALTADCVAAAASRLPAAPARWLICGGGRRNAALMAMLAERLDAPVEPVEAAGLDGDMLEAQAFAHLAVRALRGLPLSAPGATGCRAPTRGGRVSPP